MAPAVVHWSDDGWQTVHDTSSRDTGAGVYVADLPTAAVPAGGRIEFTFFWPEAARWEGRDFWVAVTPC
ncbi:MAG: hypothetical protein IT180_11855 [Acidobacteria bacterium]|nr:hypothetical protein [Acidobacteriota bacterium]